ncbi:hypothetical protein ABZ502_17600 [Streptomyces abikoensis]|uniref:hypothetical protein n=1 Tax=Streptomyces abikoensis TaxID=97398 RepID=UPI0033FE1708
MSYDTSFASHSRETTAREVWAAAVNVVEQRTADYLATALPGLAANRTGGTTDPTCLSFDRPGCGNLLVIVSPKYATLHGSGLHWEVWSPLIAALYSGEHFPLSDTDGTETEDPRATASGSYTDDSDRDSLIVRKNGTADISVFDLDIDDMAQVLAAIRGGLAHLRRQQCTRCHLAHWRHIDHHSTEKAVCDAFTLACTNCVQHADAEQCDQARTGRPCTRTAVSEQAHRRQAGEELLALLLGEFNGWDLAAIARSAVELFGTHGDVNDHLSESQKDVLERASTFFDRISEPA